MVTKSAERPAGNWAISRGAFIDWYGSMMMLVPSDMVSLKHECPIYCSVAELGIGVRVSVGKGLVWEHAAADTSNISIMAIVLAIDFISTISWNDLSGSNMVCFCNSLTLLSYNTSDIILNDIDTIIVVA